MSESTDTALGLLAERVCAAAGTDLDTVLSDLRTRRPDPATPAAVRAGWDVLDSLTPIILRKDAS